MEWISIEDKLPEFEEKIIVYCTDYGVNQGEFESINRKGYLFELIVDKHFAYSYDVTHWMPLPNPPKS